jgi:hypothetical protein
MPIILTDLTETLLDRLRVQDSYEHPATNQV